MPTFSKCWFVDIYINVIILTGCDIFLNIRKFYFTVSLLHKNLNFYFCLKILLWKFSSLWLCLWLCLCNCRPRCGCRSLGTGIYYIYFFFKESIIWKYMFLLVSLCKLYEHRPRNRSSHFEIWFIMNLCFTIYVIIYFSYYMSVWL